MNSSRLIVGACIVGAIAAVSAIAWSSNDRMADDADHTNATAPSSTPTSSSVPASMRSIPVDPLTLVHAQRFHCDMPFAHQWRGDRQMYDSGWVMVLAGDARLLQPHQSKDPVLYVGAQTAERVNAGLSGRLVVIVPGDVDLSTAPIFLGPADLPEELMQPQIDAVLAAARNGGAVAPSAEQITQATVEGTLEFADDYWLHRHAIDLVEAHSPTEVDLIAGWRAPLVR